MQCVHDSILKSEYNVTVQKNAQGFVGQILILQDFNSSDSELT